MPVTPSYGEGGIGALTPIGREHRFVGRVREMAAMLGLLQATSGGTARAVLVAGEAGIGKTRLVRELARSAADEGATILSGGCLDLGDVPYAPIVEALRGLVRDLGAPAVRELAGPATATVDVLLPGTLLEPAAGPRPGSQGMIFEAVLRLLGALAGRNPTVLVLEDLHWADRSTLDLLTFLVRSLTSERVLIVGTYRSTEITPDHPLRAVVAELLRNPHCTPLDLLGLDADHVSELFVAIAGDPPDPAQLELVVDLAEGNPFFAEELILGRNLGGSVPATVREFVLVRVEALDDASRDVLRTAAVAGRSVPHDLLAVVCDLPERELERALRRCVSRYLLSADPTGGGYRFRHALTREAVYEDLLPGERRRMHAAVARALERGGTGLPGRVVAHAELAHHWWEADVPAKALAASVPAARDAEAVFAVTEAARHYSRALALWPQVPAADRPAEPGYDELLLSAADMHRWTGDVDGALELVEQALALPGGAPDPERTGRLLDRKGRYLWEAGRGDESLAAYEQACRVLRGLPPTALLAWALAGHATSLMQAGRQRAAIEQCREALHIADRVGAASAKGRALNTLGVCLALTGRAAEGIAALREAASIADGSGRLEDVLRAYANLTYVLELTGRLREALGVAAEGIDRSRELGVELTGSGVLLANAASVLVLLGRWEEADRMLDSAGTRDMDVYAPYLEIVRADADIARGRWETASSRLAQARSSGLRISEPQFAGSVMAAQAELELWRPDYPAAIEAISEGLRALEGTDEATLRLRLCALGLRAAADARWSLVPSRQRAEVDTEHRLDAYGERLAATSDEVVAGLAGVLFPEMRALAALCRAELSRSRGRDTGAEWAAVAEGWTSLERPFPAAYAWWRRAEAAVSARESTAASCARTAHQLARRLGAVPLAAEVESLAARARIPLAEPAGAPADPDVDTGGGPAERLGLTSRERQVLAHLVLGHTNRQIARALFISEKTASVHVSNILGKLGVANRGQAAAVAHRAGLVPPD